MVNDPLKPLDHVANARAGLIANLHGDDVRARRNTHVLAAAVGTVAGCNPSYVRAVTVAVPLPTHERLLLHNPAIEVVGVRIGHTRIDDRDTDSAAVGAGRPHIVSAHHFREHRRRPR